MAHAVNRFNLKQSKTPQCTRRFFIVETISLRRKALGPQTRVDTPTVHKPTVFIINETAATYNRDYIMSDEIVRDSNGTQLNDGDAVTLVKDLKVKGTSTTLKRGTLVKNIRLTGNPEEVDCSTKQVKGLVLRTEFLRKA